MKYAYLADLVALVHCAFVAFVVGGELAVLAGAALGWSWVRNLTFRIAHLAAIVLVALEAVFGVICPLTRWEFLLREIGGERAQMGTFVGALLHKVLYYDFPAWVFPAAYAGFALVVSATFILVPPRRNP